MNYAALHKALMPEDSFTDNPTQFFAIIQYLALRELISILDVLASCLLRIPRFRVIIYKLRGRSEWKPVSDLELG